MAHPKDKKVYRHNPGVFPSIQRVDYASYLKQHLLKDVSIRVLKGYTRVVNIGGTHQMFSWANEFCEEIGRDVLIVNLRF